MRFTPVILSAILAAAVGACAGTNPVPDDEETTKEPGFAGLENVRFLTGAQPFRKVAPSGNFDFILPFAIPDDPRVDAAGFDQRLRASITRELAEKGYTHGAADPVFLVKISVVLDEKVNAFAPIRGAGKESQWIRSVEGDASFEKGALILDLLDPKDQWTLWRGVCGAHVTIDVSQADEEQRVEMIVQRLLKGFPAE